MKNENYPERGGIYSYTSRLKCCHRVCSLMGILCTTQIFARKSESNRLIQQEVNMENKQGKYFSLLCYRVDLIQQSVNVKHSNNQIGVPFFTLYFSFF